MDAERDDQVLFIGDLLFRKLCGRFPGFGRDGGRELSASHVSIGGRASAASHSFGSPPRVTAPQAAVVPRARNRSALCLAGTLGLTAVERYTRRAIGHHIARIVEVRQRKSPAQGVRHDARNRIVAASRDLPDLGSLLHHHGIVGEEVAVIG